MPIPKMPEEKFDLQKELKHPHNQYCVTMFTIPSLAIAFMKYALQDETILPMLDLEKLTVEDGHLFDQSSFKDSYADIVYSIPFNDNSGRKLQAIVIIEHKSYDDHWAVFQLGRYIMQKLIEFSPSGKKKDKEQTSEFDELEPYMLPTMIPILIHHGENPYSGATALNQFFPKIEGFEHRFLNFEPIIIDLNTIDFDKLPDDPNEWRLNVVFRVMKQMFLDNHNLEGVEDCFKRIFPHVNEDSEFAFLAKFTIRYFMDGTDFDPNEYISFIDNNYPLDDTEVKHMAMSMTQRLRNEGRMEGILEGQQKGLLEGRMEGRLEGRLEGQQRFILSVLTRRFRTVPTSIREKIQDVHDEVVLESLLIDAMECQCLEDFQGCLL